MRGTLSTLAIMVLPVLALADARTIPHFNPEEAKLPRYKATMPRILIPQTSGQDCPTGFPVDPSRLRALPRDIAFTSHDRKEFVRPVKNPTDVIRPGCILVFSQNPENSNDVFVKATHGNHHASLVGNFRGTLYHVSPPINHNGVLHYGLDSEFINTGPYHILCRNSEPPKWKLENAGSKADERKIIDDWTARSKYIDSVEENYFYTIAKNLKENNNRPAPKGYRFDYLFVDDLDNESNLPKYYKALVQDHTLPENGYEAYCVESALCGLKLSGEKFDHRKALVRAVSYLDSEQEIADLLRYGIARNAGGLSDKKKEQQIKNFAKALWQQLKPMNEKNREIYLNDMIVRGDLVTSHLENISSINFAKFTLNAMAAGKDILMRLKNLVSPNDLLLSALDDNGPYHYVGTYLGSRCKVSEPKPRESSMVAD